MKKVPFIIAGILIAAICAGAIIFMVNANCDKDIFANTKLDYGTSELYTKEDMDKGVELIKKQLGEWDVKEVYSITYAGDERCTAESAESGETKMVFLSDFHTSKNADRNGSWNADDDYKDWGWILTKNADGEWTLTGWGYA